MKHIRIIYFLCSVLTAVFTKAQGPCGSINPSSIKLVAFPTQAAYCAGSKISFSVNTTYPLPPGLLSWSYSGTANAFNINPNQYDVIGVITGGVVTVSGFVVVGGVNCPFTRTFNLVVGSANNLAANAGPDQIYGGNPVSIGSPPNCATGGTSPYTYDWQPNSGFTGGTNNTQCSPLVAPGSTTIYNLTVTDSYGCRASDNMMVVNTTSFPIYIVPKKTVDGGYQVPKNGFIYFKFEEEYRTSTLTYQITDYQPAPANIAAPVITCPPTSTVKNLGDNRYSINISGCGLGTPKYYLVEITNDKREKFYFKFLN